MASHINSQIAVARRLAAMIADTETSAASALRVMRERGWKSLGRGAFSVAFAHDLYPGTVIKVSAQPTERSTRIMRDGFPEYVNAILRDWIRSSFAPRVYFTSELKHCDRVTVTVMERCYPCKNKEFIEKAARTATNLNSSRACYEAAMPRSPARRFLETLRQYGELDIHGRNIMTRRDGSLVFTDPLVIY